METYEMRDNTLVANADLYWENHSEFRQKCADLIASEHQDIVLDLTAVSFIFSVYMGTIGRLLADAARTNKKLTIRISENMRWMFDLVGFDKMINIDVVS